jgi:Mrp family chromosome partitioning ATPase
MTATSTNRHSIVTLTPAPILATEIVAPELASSVIDTSGQMLSTDVSDFRVDPATDRMVPHYRAQQLREFIGRISSTGSQPLDSSAHTAKMTPRRESPAENPLNPIPLLPPTLQTLADEGPILDDRYVSGIRTDTLFRIDGPARFDQSASNPRQSVPKPHFPTAHYTPPQTFPRQFRSSEMGQLRPPSAAQKSLPSDGYDPMSGVRNPVSDAASIERVAGNTHESIARSTAAWEVAAFAWPDISNQLLRYASSAFMRIQQELERMISRVDNRVAVTAPARGNGCTTIAISLARYFSAQGKRVLVVDADLANPDVGARVGMTKHLSWLQAVSRRCKPSEVVVSQIDGRECIMPLSPMIQRVRWPRKIYDHLGAILDQLRHEFDLVLLDVGPATQLIDESSRATTIVDAAILVTGAIGSDIEVQRSRAGLLTFGVDRLILAENFQPARSPQPALAG